MANLVFSLSRKQVAGKSEVLCRFYAGRLNQRAKTGVYVLPQVWNTDEGRCNISKRYESPANAEARQAQAELDNIAAHVFNMYTHTRVFEDDWLQRTIATYYKPQQSRRPLADYIEEYCTARNVMPQTRKKMYVLRNLLNEYAKHNEALTQQLTRQDLDCFSCWLLSGNRSENTTHSKLRQVRTLLYWVGKPYPNPFDNYKIPADAYGTPIYLTKEERDFVTMYNDLSPQQKVQRDIFIFQCHTGCRVGDLIRLTPANICNGWLVYVPRKTSRAKPFTIEIPLSPVALQIVERYRGIDIHNRLLPFATEQGYNRAIHMILKQCACNRSVMVFDPLTRTTTPRQLWEVATSHTARKTFTQILYAATNDKRLVASLTGHSENSQAFNRYSEITRDIKQAAVEKAL